MTAPDPSDAIWQRAEIDSPCVKVCVVHPTARLCVGCLRTIDEISGWSRMSPDTRRAIMAELTTRQSHFGGRRGGRAARLAG